MDGIEKYFFRAKKGVGVLSVPLALPSPAILDSVQFFPPPNGPYTPEDAPVVSVMIGRQLTSLTKIASGSLFSETGSAVTLKADPALQLEARIVNLSFEIPEKFRKGKAQQNSSLTSR
jgi:hypothetical protein